MRVHRPSWMRLPPLALAAALLMPACAGVVDYFPLIPPTRPLSPHPPEKVEVFVVTPPARPHTNLGLFEVRPGQNDRSTYDMVAALRRSAAAIGCDAVLITSLNSHLGTGGDPSIHGACIVYNDIVASDGNAAASSVTPGSVTPGSMTPASNPTPPPTSPWRSALIAASPGEVRTAPFVVAPLLIRLDAGQRVSVSRDATNGWRVARLLDGHVGYIQDTALRLE
jgi:hypothetical protein